MQLKPLIIFLATIASASQWQVEGLRLWQEAGETRMALSQGEWQGHAIKNVQYVCPEHTVVYPQHQCQQASLSLDALGHHWSLQLSSEIDWGQNQWQIGAQLFEGQLALFLDESFSDNLPIQLKQLSWQHIQSLLKIEPLDDLQAQLSGDLFWNTTTGHVVSDALVIEGFDNAWGDEFVVAALGGQGQVDLDTEHIAAEWAFDINQGEALLGPVYLNFNQVPLKLSGQVRLDGGAGWSVQLKIQDPSSHTLLVDADLNEQGELQTGQLHWQVQDAAILNKNGLSSVLDLYGFKGSLMEGAFELRVVVDQQKVQSVDLSFNEFYFENTLRKLATQNLNGELHWADSTHEQVSELTWDGLLVAGIPVGQAVAEVLLQQDEVKVLGQPEWPVFDGSIAIENWQITALFSPELDMELSATIHPMSLALVTEKMGWPIMSGKLSGRIPSVVKKGPVMRFEGGLDLKVFEGTMRINDLATERLFGVAPVIAADIQFEGLNLGQVTETFDFGKITGMLSGTVRDLRVTNWKTDRLDAEIYTVKHKGVDQTISQQAVDNISSLGGIQGAVSRSFLRFFDDFKYKQIRLSCVLHNAVCQIGGIKNTGRQFTIVEGGGIPKINIVGFVRKIDWETFVSRLLHANYD